MIQHSLSDGDQTVRLSELCHANFGANIRKRGKQYFDQSRVEQLEQDGNELLATVHGHYDNYPVSIDLTHLDEGHLTGVCECEHYRRGNACKHLWATILAYDEEMKRLNRAKRASSGPVSSGGLPAETSSTAQPKLWKDAFSGLQGQPAPSPSPSRGSSATTEMIWFALNIGSTELQGEMEIELCRQQTGSEKRPGLLRSFPIDPYHLPKLGSREDRELLEALVLLDVSPAESSGWGPRYSDQIRKVRLPGTALDMLLPRLCATGRFVWRLNSIQNSSELPQLSWDSGEPWQLKLNITTDEAQPQWLVGAVLVREAENGTETVPLERTALLIEGRIALIDNRLSRVDAVDQTQWIDQFRQNGNLVVPFADREAFLQAMWQMPALPAVDLPQELQLEEIRPAPQGLLRVLPRDGVAPRGWLPAELLFDYSGYQIRPEEPGAGMLSAAGDRYCHRDFEQEAALENRLLELGLQHSSRNNWSWGGFSDQKTPSHELRETEMVRTVGALIDEGWLVEAEGRPLRTLSHSSFRVNSAVDWFELEGEFDFDGASARLPELLAAARNGQRFLQLDDGSQGLLPQAWLERFGSVAELGEAEDGTVRFQPSQALLLDSMLEAQDSRASIDRQFAAFRRKLRSFSGVKPRNAPRGFHGGLREYQRDGLGWLNFLQKFGFGGCLADDMGLGKTIQVLALLESRRVRRKSEGEAHAPSLAVVPKSLIFNWLEEAARFTPNLRVAEYHGTDRARILEQTGELDLIVTTYGTLRQDIATLKEIDFDYAILDEAQAIKNAQSQAAKACRLLKTKHRLAMTGTPIENHLGELWSLFEFLNPGLLGRSKAFQQISKQSADQPDSLALLARAVSPYILRRTRQQVLPELPEKTEQTLYVELPRQQRRLYNELRDHYRALLSDRIETEGLQKSKIHVLEALLRLRQAACHPGLLDRKRHEDSSAKFDLLMEQLAIVIEEGSKALVFSQFTSLLGLLRERLDETGVDYEYLDGKTSNRQEPVRRFQEDPDCRLFLISIKAGGFGLNLTAAEFVYILDPWWNPAVEAQAVARSHRIGQLKPMRACRLIARDTIEEKIVELQKSKQDLADAVINSSSSLIQQLTAEDLQLLLT